MGWWSWTAHYFGLNEGIALTNARWLAQHLRSLGYQFFHIDEGYQYARGEYTTPDSTLFPEWHGRPGTKGSRRRPDSRHMDRAIPRLRTGPGSTRIIANWLVHNAKGEPIRIGQVDGKDRLFVIDTTNPDAQEYLRKTYSTLVNDWNIGYIKLDFMEDTAVEGFYCRPNTTRARSSKNWFTNHSTSRRRTSAPRQRREPNAQCCRYR